MSYCDGDDPAEHGHASLKFPAGLPLALGGVMTLLLLLVGRWLIGS